MPCDYIIFLLCWLQLHKHNTSLKVHMCLQLALFTCEVQKLPYIEICHVHSDRPWKLAEKCHLCFYFSELIHCKFPLGGLEKLSANFRKCDQMTCSVVFMAFCLVQTEVFIELGVGVGGEKFTIYISSVSRTQMLKFTVHFLINLDLMGSEQLPV
jgi:hypothetical protein